MKILFLHGWHSTPGGRKPSYLIEKGHEVLNPALCPDDYDKALNSAQTAFDEGKPDLVVGSSRGGALAMNIKSDQIPLLLMCPAWKHWGEATRVESPCLIIHSRQDEVIDFEHSIELVANSHLPKDALIEVGHEHRLACVASLEAMEKACVKLHSLANAPQQT